ncbi:MAG: glycosyltransferase [Deltaproteobacteria bacterium]|nr:glycosyltransferase [Deltaproteobacteria bacterium]
MPKVSIIIPTHNRALFVKEAIQSILCQTFQDFELIVVDDGSHDHTFETLHTFKDKMIYHYQKNKGVSAARNKGISLAKGDWVCFLDSDDLWTKEKLQIQLKETENSGFLVSYTEEIWHRKGKRVNPKDKHQKFSGYIYEKCLPLCIISSSSVMIHKSVFGKAGFFDESLPACEDYDLWLRISAHFPIHLIRKPLIIKRNGHEEQLSQKYWGLDRFRILALEKMLLSHKISSYEKKKTLEELYCKSRIFAQGALKRKKILEGAHYYQKTLKAQFKLTFT